MRQFKQDELVHHQPYCRTRSRHGHDHYTTRYAGRGPAHPSGRADFGIAQITKQLTKTRQFLLQTAMNHLIGAVAWRQIRAAAQQNSIRALCLNAVSELTPNVRRLILDDGVGADGMARLGEGLLYVLTTRVVLRRVGVAHSDDGTPHAVRSLLPVLLVTHDACPSAKAGKGPTSCTSLPSGRAESRSRTRTPAAN